MIIHWFRKNLRTEDNPSWERALEEARKNRVKVIPLWSSSLFHRNAGKFRKSFLEETLEDLRSELALQGHELVETSDSPATWFKTHAPSARVFTEELPGEWERAELKALIEVLGAINVSSVWDRTLFPLEELPGGVQNLPSVFTNFYRGIVLKKDWPILPSFGEKKKTHLGHKGHARLQKYIWETRAVDHYKESRNGLLHDLDSSRLSPFLSLGSLGSRQIYHEIRRFESEHGANSSTEAFIYELIWRDYFQFYLLKYGSKVFQRNGILEVPVQKKQTYSNEEKSYELWKAGKTAHRFVNAHMNELRETGWMSNRGRQVVASYLIHDLKVDWRKGAQYFESQLIDDDVASNWGNWNYLAGVGADPRKNRYFNPDLQAERYDPDESYQKKWT